MYQTILLPLDLNDEASWKKALPTALELCRAHGAKIHVMTVVPDFGMAIVGSFFPEGYHKKALADADAALTQFVAAHVPGDQDAAHDVHHGTVYEEILRAAKRLDADLIVMAAHRPGQSDYLLGPNAARVVRHAACSVLVVRD
jgi:nucleotide-binding universal stress UspA family protein